MAKLTKDQLRKRLFSDPKNYPYGFSRSGDFSINESKALAEHGCLIAALVDGEVEAETNEEKQILAAAHGASDPSTPAEKAWCKYQKRINRPRLGSIYGRNSSSVDEDSDMGESSEVEIEIDD